MRAITEEIIYKYIDSDVLNNSKKFDEARQKRMKNKS